MAKTLGYVVNSSLVVIGEPEITAFTSTNILQTQLINEANDRVRMVMGKFRYPWTLQRDTIQFTDDITDLTVAVTEGLNTIDSVDANGNDAQEFDDVTAGMKIVIGTDTFGHVIEISDIISVPHQLRIDALYPGTTNGTASCVIFKDTYSLSGLSGLDEIKLMSYGDNTAFPQVLSGRLSNNEVMLVSLETLYRAAGGNLFRDTSGKPRLASMIGSDSDDNRQILFWPYPKDDYVVEVWYTAKFSTQSAFNTVLFGDDAPDLAYDVVDYGCRAAALLYDEDETKAAYWEKRSREALGDLIARENRDHADDKWMRLDTFRVPSTGNVEVRSQIAFDTKPAWRG